MAGVAWKTGTQKVCSQFPEEFEDLPRDCIERIWDAFVDEASGVYVNKDEFEDIFGVVDKEVKVVEGLATAIGTPLMRLFSLFEIPLKAGWADGFEVLGALILASGQLARREKLLLLRDRCMLFSPLNAASVINGGSLALYGRRELESAEQIKGCRPREIDSWMDRFRHRKIKIRVKVLRTGPDVVEENLKISVEGRVKQFSSDGIVEIEAMSGTQATVGSGLFILKTGKQPLKGRTEFDHAEVLVTELDGLKRVRESGDSQGMRQRKWNQNGEVQVLEMDGLTFEGDEFDEGDSDDEEDLEFRARAEACEPGYESNHEAFQPEVSAQSINERRFPGEMLKNMDNHIERIASIIGFNNAIEPMQIASGEFAFAAGRFVVVEDLLHQKPNSSPRVWTVHDKEVAAFTVHPKGKWIVSVAKKSKKILVWDTQRLEIVGSIDAVIAGPQILSISRSGDKLFCLNKTEKRFAFYNISKLESPELISSDRLPSWLIVNCAEILGEDEAIIAGSEVYRIAKDRTQHRMRWGKTAEKSVQDSLSLLSGIMSCITSSSACNMVYLWSGDICTHSVRLDALVVSLAVSPIRGQSTVVAGLGDGSLQALSGRNLERVQDLKAASGVKPLKSALCRLHAGLSGLLAMTADGKLAWLPSTDSNKEGWSIVKQGHGQVNSPLKWSYCGTYTVATCGVDQVLRFWDLSSLTDPDHKEFSPKCTAQVQLGARATAVAGTSSKAFVALENRTITQVQVGPTLQRGPGRHSFPYSIPYVDSLATSENMIAAVCLRARLVEVRSIPGGVPITKLTFDAGMAAPLSVILRESQGRVDFLRFQSTKKGREVLRLFKTRIWDARSWKPLGDEDLAEELDDELEETQDEIYVPRAGSSCLLLSKRERISYPEQREYTQFYGDYQLATPYIRRVTRIPISTSALSSKLADFKKDRFGDILGGVTSKTQGRLSAFPIIAADGRLVRGVAVHPDWNKAMYAIGSENGFVECNSYRLCVEGVVHGLVFDNATCLAVCTSQEIVIFDWRAGVRLSSASRKSAGTIGMEFLNENKENLQRAFLCCVNAEGSIERWDICEDTLIYDPEKSILDAKATCLTRSGIFGTIDGYLRHVDDPTVVKGDLTKDGPVLSICEDRSGFLVGSRSGAVHSFTLTVQEIPVRKNDALKYDLPVFAVSRSALEAEILVQTSDGNVFADKELVHAYQVNSCIPIAKLPNLIFTTSDTNKKEAFTWKFILESGKGIRIENDLVKVVGQFVSPESECKLDSPCKNVSISSNEQLLAMCTERNDLYILDTHTAALVYFWPGTLTGQIDSLEFEVEEEKSQKTQPSREETLLVNGQPFFFKD